MLPSFCANASSVAVAHHLSSFFSAHSFCVNLACKDSRISFLGWFLEQSEAVLPPAQVTLVEIGREDFRKMTPEEKLKPLPKGEAARRSLSPLEYALFLQAVLEFQPIVIGIEPIVIWRDRDKAQEQVFIDQAMRVPKLLVGIQLGEKGKRDLAVEDMPSFPNVTGSRGFLAQFTGIYRQPDDDIRLISTPGFTNLPDERTRRSARADALRLSRRNRALVSAPSDHALAARDSGGRKDRARLEDHFA